MTVESALSAQALLAFTLLNALVAIILKAKVIDIFDRPFRLFEFFLFLICILFVPVCGLFWIVLDLFEIDIFPEFRALLLPATPVSALLLVASWHGAAHFVYNNRRD